MEWETKIDSGLVPILLQNTVEGPVMELQGKPAAVTQGDDVQVGNCLLEYKYPHAQSLERFNTFFSHLGSRYLELKRLSVDGRVC